MDGRDQWILCHLEIQSSFEADFIPRIDLYNSGLKWLFQQEVLTLVILADLNPDWRPSEYHFEFGGNRTDRQFTICKVLDHLQTDWANTRTLMVEVARAQIAALRTAGDPDSRYNSKTELVRNLYTAGYNQDEIREIFRLIDWMMHLRPDLDRRFQSELIAYEKELKMPYVTSFERLAKADGGIEILLRILTRRFGQLPVEVEREVQRLSLEQSQALGDAVLDIQTTHDLENWLKSMIR